VALSKLTGERAFIQVFASKKAATLAALLSTTAETDRAGAI
jgi:hypothetical protein